MLFACTIGDETISQLEEQIKDVQLSEELAGQPPGGRIREASRAP